MGPEKVRMVCDYGNHQELEREIENLKAELEAAYESRKLPETAKCGSVHMEYVCIACNNCRVHCNCDRSPPERVRKPREQEMNEKKMSEG